MRIVEHTPELAALIPAFAATEALDVLLDDHMPGVGAPLPQLQYLVVSVLFRPTAVVIAVFFVCAHPSIDRDAHRSYVLTHTVSGGLMYRMPDGSNARISTAF